MDSGEPRHLLYDAELSAIVGDLNRKASGEPESATVEAVIEIAREAPSAPSSGLLDLLERAVRRRASDLLLVVGAPPVVRVDGELERVTGPALTAVDVRELLIPLLDGRRRRELVTQRFADFAFDVAGLGRFRVNVHFERGRLGACLRSLPSEVPRLEDLGLPPSLDRLAEQRSGLILVVGPAGSGKSTTLAALLDRVVRTRAVHAITIEEPVEYVHRHHRSLVEQVEIPVDCTSFAEALRSALRQSPDVLLVGEMRDSATMSAAITAAETGHLVLASVHAFTSPQAIHRIIDTYPAEQQDQVRRQLALTLSCIVAQRLVQGSGRSRVVAAEVLWATDAVRNLVREGRIHQLGQAMMSGQMQGMITLEAALAELVKSQRIDRGVAESHAYHPDELRQLLG